MAISTKQLLDDWKKKLLDLSKRNSLINFKETRRGSLQIDYPHYSTLFSNLLDEKTFRFAKPIAVDLFEEEAINLVPGKDYDIKSSKDSLSEEQSILRLLRRKAKTITEEQGINVLHLTFGQLYWKDSANSSEVFVSPLVLVPVSLNLESITSPFELDLQDDDVTVNPTLKYKLEHDCNIHLPEFNDEQDIRTFLDNCTKVIYGQPGWKVERKVFLSTFSYLKINIYNDLCDNETLVCNNPIVKALSGDISALTNCESLLDEIKGLNLDRDIKPEDSYQVLDADSSQQEAIELAKRGASFVLQGPPGTGKSQTITNIIAECLANGKKVLFVSEKEAALDVVKNRLTQTGIMDFCLAMHSHKANKKEIINELFRTASLPKKKFKSENLTKLDNLYCYRNKLNSLTDELHLVHNPLNKSIFEVYGELSALVSVPNVIIDINDVNNVTIQELDKRIETIAVLTRTIESFHGDRFSPLWGNCVLSTLSNQNKNDFRALINEDFSNALIDILFQIHNLLGQSNHVSWNKIDSYVSFFQYCISGTRLPESWLRPDCDIESIQTLAKVWNNKKADVSKSESIVTNSFQNCITSYNANELQQKINFLNSFLTDSTQFAKLQPKCDEFVISIGALLKQSNNAISLVNEVLSCLSNLGDLSLNVENKPVSYISEIVNLLITISSINYINSYWFQTNASQTIRRLIDDTNATIRQIIDIRTEICNRFDESIFDLDVSNLLPKFRTDYSSPFRFLKKSYRKDIKFIRGYEKSGKLEYPDALNLLNQLNIIREREKNFQTNSENYHKYFGLESVSYQTDMLKFEETLEKICNVNNFYCNSIPASAQQFILNQELRTSLLTNINSLSAITDRKGDIDEIEQFESLNSNITIGELRNNAMLVKDCAVFIMDHFETLQGLSKSTLKNLSMIDDVIVWCQYIKDLEHNTSLLEQSFEYLYHGKDTDWNDILSKLHWLIQYRDIESRLLSPDDFLRQVTSDSNTIEKCITAINAITENKNKYTDTIEWFATWFGQRKSLLEYDLEDVINIVHHYQKNIDYLDEWLGIKHALDKCISLGMISFVEKVANDPQIPCDSFIGIYKKRFYSRWLDSYIPKLPTLSEISMSELAQLIEKFKEIDKAQFEFAKHRIYELLSAQLPNVDISNGANDQFGILRREYNKKRRQLPLRLLFNQLPILIQRIKPCMMMSPLSVSLFLQNNDYHFDIVIFDEASQIKPENAIGSIVRGSQIVVAGDTHQLPPTSFFEKTNSDDEFDTGENENDNYALEESILDATANILPEKYLKWHYRSRHEHLIAFSNSKIYDGRLTTFPSSIDSQPDYGVEFVYVPNGVYERSGKRINQKEAEKVADLVFEHFENHPDRSLGIISNSESQARAIEELIFKRRTQHQSFERFFNENQSEPFFIKSLESVQGDERDTIIFSVGYGKDLNGKMYNSFGPINLEGGERRLNVAITRAKFNLKLVASINADDIVISENSKQGPRLLKSYIDFAKRGMPAISSEIIDGKELHFDSPFEESVYNYLTEQGFDVSTQVGCAGYRIDLAVRDPNKPGRYILAIECDGATYHSTPYARERDRLRQSILENIGWNFYRLWSTEWINHTANEKTKLIEAINLSIANQLKDNHDKQSDIINDESLSDIVTDVPNDLFSNGYDYEHYYFTNELKLRNSQTLYEIIEHIVYSEAPIHKEYLYKKLAPFLNRERVTNIVREQVDNELHSYHLCGKYVIVNDFIYLRPKQAEYKMREVAGRDISIICPEELQDLMLQVAKKAIGIGQEDLINATAHAVGYAHCKERIFSILTDVFTTLVKKSKLSISSSGMVLIKD